MVVRGHVAVLVVVGNRRREQETLVLIGVRLFLLADVAKFIVIILMIASALASYFACMCESLYDGVFRRMVKDVTILLCVHRRELMFTTQASHRLRNLKAIIFDRPVNSKKLQL